MTNVQFTYAQDYLLTLGASDVINKQNNMELHNTKWHSNLQVLRVQIHYDKLLRLKIKVKYFSKLLNTRPSRPTIAKSNNNDEFHMRKSYSRNSSITPLKDATLATPLINGPPSMT